MNTLLLLILCLAPALQDGWRDTHRVHLRNGNFLDGRLEQINDKEILFRWSPGVLLRIKVGDIRGDVEEIKIRTLHSEPRKVAVRPPPIETQPDVEPSTPEPRDPSKAPSEIERLFKRLMSRPDMTYEVLVREVKALGIEGARAMIAEMPSMDAQMSQLAIVAMDQMRELPVEREIRGLLESKRPDLRAAACNALANRGATDSMRAIQTALRDRSPHVRSAALMALPAFGDGSVLPAITELTIDQDPNVRARAFRSAEDLSSKAGLDNDLAQRLLSLSGRGPTGSVAESATALGRLADRSGEGFPTDDVRNALLDMMSMREPETRGAAAFALSSVKPPGPSADAVLDAMARERDPKAIVSMCDALGRLKIQKSLEPLIEKLRDDSKDVAAAARRSLEKITGQTEPGADYQKWREWYEGQGGR
jgi:HEAT repeat protein